MLVKRLVSSLVPFVLALSLTLAGQAGSAGAAPPSGTATIVTWNGIAVKASVLVAKQAPAASYIYISFEQAAVYDAVVAIEGGFQPYHYVLSPHHPNASVDAAVASAAHDVLVHYFPAQQATFDAALAASLASVADSPDKSDGIAIGQASAASLIAFRQGDGLEANIGFTMPAPAIGVFQLPAGQSPQIPWLSKLRPFMLNSPDQFRPGPPPALDSPDYAASFFETKYFGSANSLYRNAEMTDIARFWTSSNAIQDENIYGGLAVNDNLSPVQAARLFAMGYMVTSDALIACFDAKYHYLAWRPAFAIPQGEADGNPLTTGDPTWTSLAPTPPHPEYPSAHTCGSEAEVYVLTAFMGSPNINIDVIGTVPGLVQTTRHYQTANQLIDQVANARIWAGFHFRFSTTAGIRLGQQVAVWDLQNYFRPVY